MDFLRRGWHFLRWPVVVLAVLYFGLVAYRVPHFIDKAKSDKAVALIHAQKITLDDVMGKHFPPPPDLKLTDATVAGVDNNNNGVRDDVERAIFANYPNSARIRAAELQYAAAIQLMITEVFDTDTWIAAVKETSRGGLCIGITSPNNDLSIYLSRSKETKDLVLNTTDRKDAWDKAYNYTTSFALPNTNLCNVDLNTLPN